MSQPLTVECEVHFAYKGRRGPKELQPGPMPVRVEVARVPRVSRLMALALKFEAMIERGEVRDYADLARLGRVTRARMSQIMSLLNLAPDLIEALLHLPTVGSGRDPVVLRDLLPMTAQMEWGTQRRKWRQLTAHHLSSSPG